MCAWLRAEAAAGRLNWRHIAVDGKTVRGARDGDGKAPHLLSVYDVSAGTVLGQDSVDAKTNEITCFVPLLQAIIDGRARRGRGTGGGDGSGCRDDDGNGADTGGSQQQRDGDGEGGELVIVTATTPPHAATSPGTTPAGRSSPCSACEHKKETKT